jgi:hypothetical protein
MPLDLARQFPITMRVLRQVAQLVQDAWTALRPRPRVQERPQIRLTAQATQLSATVTMPSVAGMELGQAREAYHLPSRVRWAQSRAARRNKAGRYYLVIPLAPRGARRTRGSRAGTVTFRTMTPDSPGWWIPARPTSQASQATMPAPPPQAQGMLEAAARQDIEALMQQALGR